VDAGVIKGLQERFRDTGRGIAEHGLLFGRVIDGAIEIFEYRPVSNRTLAETLAELPAEPRERLLVGCYRTEHGEALRLNEDDLLLFKTFFGKRYQVFLLIQPSAFAPPNATFFFSRADRTISEFPLLEFPLDVSLLATEKRSPITADSGKVPTGGATNLKIAAGMLVSAFLAAAVSATRPRPVK
jgi:hypothetical protein